MKQTIQHCRELFRRIVICFLALLICLTVSLTASAEEPALSVDPTGQEINGDGYSAVLYDNTNGLSTSEANDICCTPDGCIWIGSYSGLTRYDGNIFDRVDSTTGIASVVSLFVDGSGRLWVGTNDSGLGMIEKENIRIYRKSDGLGSSSVRSIVQDNSGELYIGTTQGISVIDSNLKMRRLNIPELNEAYIRMLQIGSDGETIYGVTMESAVFTIRNGSLDRYVTPEQLGITDVHSILPDPKDSESIYIGTKGSMLYHGRLTDRFEAEQTYDISPLGYINSIGHSKGIIWVCTDQGIGFVQNEKFTVLENVPLNTSIENMLVDYQGNLWFVSSQQGVMKIVPNMFADIFEKYGLEDEVVNTTCMYNSQLLIGTKTNGLLSLKEGKQLHKIVLTSSATASGKACPEDTDLMEILKGSKIRSIFRDSKNRVWFCTFGENALLRLDKGELTRFTTEDGLPSERVRAVCESRDGTIYVACTGGVACIEENRITRVYGADDGIRNTEILTVTEMQDGTILAGTDGDGIYVIDGEKVTHLGMEDGLGSDVVMRIKPDRQRELCWIVTSNSIAYINAEKQITTVQKFPYSNNFDLYENSHGDMWILSSNGIYVVPSSQLIANGEISPIFYGRENGLANITTANSYSDLTDTGELYIAGTTGVSRVNINKPFEDISKINICVPYVEADGVKYFPDSSGKITIPSTTSKLTVYGSIYNYSLNNPYVTYYLTGIDREGRMLRRSDFTPVDYTNLKGGTYHFVMSLSDEEGNKSNEVSVEILKQPALYELPWFTIVSILVAVMLIAMIVMYIMHRREMKYKKKQAEDKQLISEIVTAFAKVIDMKDEYTRGHSVRVAHYTTMLARELGYDEETVEKYHNIALLHDIGKVGIPQEVLNKPGKLTDEEFAIIKSHSKLGFNALKDISIMPELAVGAGAHHERPDGKGYPKGLKGDEIPRVAQIIAVADTFDAMYSDRPYRKRMNFEKTVSIIREVAGTQLQKDVVDAFLRLVDQGEFRLPGDTGGGTTENIDNIRAKQ
ncbi:MAG: HD domain-containing protein [Oscillospiraceae bacterium]|nr:HD domain-containing protein [Oscillospiraceae bacterium]